MSDSEEESSNSENNWPMNEDWMLDILKDDDKSEARVKINVISFKFCLENFQTRLNFTYAKLDKVNLIDLIVVLVF